jgi:hypothetical protein
MRRVFLWTDSIFQFIQCFHSSLMCPQSGEKIGEDGRLNVIHVAMVWI